MVQFAGKYKRTQEEKYEDFLSKLGVGFMMRKAATASTPSMEITDVGGGTKFQIIWPIFGKQGCVGLRKSMIFQGGVLWEGI